MAKVHILIFIMALTMASLTFQNCSQFSETTENISSTFSEGTPIDNHMSNTNLTRPQQQIRLVNRRYVSELFRDIFTAPDGQAANNLEVYIFNWATKRGTQLGGSCDLLGSTTGTDCNGDISNANQSAHTDPNTIRESFKIQLCEELLGQDVGLSIVLNKLGVTANDSNPFSNEKLQLAYELFYRTDEIPDYYVETLKGFIFELQQKQEPTNTIWRGVLLLICESSDWQKI